jgi:hypothetical protein
MNALGYAGRGWRVFPARGKTPLLSWRDAATTDPGTIAKWWKRWPFAVVGVVTGEVFVVLDVDIKDGESGLDTLEELGFPFAFETPTVHTPRGGLHLYFKVPDPVIRNTAGKRGRGIGSNLDWRGLGGCAIGPSARSGYSWDPILGIDTPLAEVPAALLPKEPVIPQRTRPDLPNHGVSSYVLAALDGACRKIISAPNGEQEAVINGECFSLGTLNELPVEFALDMLRWAVGRVPSYDRRQPWRPGELDQKVTRAFYDGRRHPRGRARHA